MARLCYYGASPNAVVTRAGLLTWQPFQEVIMPIPQDSTSTPRSGVYLITCTANGKVYVGSAVNLAKRWSEHRRGLDHDKHHCRHLQNAWNKYGATAFKWSVLELVSTEGLTTEEIRAILIARAILHRLARCDTARVQRRTTAGSRLGSKASAETRTAIAAALRGRKQSPKHAAKTAEMNRRKRQDPEHQAKHLAAIGLRSQNLQWRAKLSAAKQGKKHSAEHAAKTAAAHRGMKASAETRAKMSAARRGKKHSEEHRVKISAAMQDPEVRAKMSVAMRESWQRRRETKRVQAKYVQRTLF